MPYEPKQMLLMFGVPAAISLVLMLIAWRPWSSAAASGHWAAPVAIGVGFIAGVIALLGKRPAFPPSEAVDWLLYAAAVVAVLGILETFLPLWAEVRGLHVIVAAGATLFFVLRPIIKNTWPAEQSVITLFAMTAGAYLAWFLIERASERDPNLLPPLILTIAAGGLAAYMMLSDSLTLGVRAGVLAATLGPIALIGAWSRKLSLARGAAGAFTVLFTGLLAACYVYPPEPIGWRLLVIAAAPLVGLAALWLPLRGWKRPVVSIALTVIALLVVMIPAYLDFKKAQESPSPW